MNRTLLLCLFVMSACNGPDPVEMNMPGPKPGPTTPPDVTAPYLVSHYPSAGARDVPLMLPLSIDFSEPVKPETLVVELSPALPMGAPQWLSQNTSVTLELGALADDTTYTVRVKATDLGGLSTAPNTSFSFTTARAPVKATPVLLGSVPAGGALKVPVDQVISLEFSVPMDPGELRATLDPAVALGQPEWSSGSTQVRFPAAAPLSSATRYTLTIQGKSAEGVSLAAPVRISFDTDAPADTVAPVVASSAPAMNGQNVPASSSISVKFSEPMERTSTQAAFSVTPAVACMFAWDATGERLFCVPQAPLALGTRYDVQVGTGAKDLAGNALAIAFALAFDTAAAPDTTPPAIISSTPANAATGVALGGAISLTFSEAMDPASTEVAFTANQLVMFQLQRLSGSFTWTNGNTTVTFRPASPLPHGALVFWSIAATAKDAAGNALAAPANGNFRVLRLLSQTVYATNSLDGWMLNNGGTGLSSTTMSVGDMNGPYLRSFVSFDLGQLPSNSIAVTDATLYIHQAGTLGSPYTLGSLYAYGVVYGSSLSAPDFDGAVQLGPRCSALICPSVQLKHLVSTSGSPGYKSIAVGRKVTLDFDQRAQQGSRSQFRFQFDTADNLNGIRDTVLLSTGESTSRPYLVVTFEAP